MNVNINSLKSLTCGMPAAGLGVGAGISATLGTEPGAMSCKTKASGPRSIKSRSAGISGI